MKIIKIIGVIVLIAVTLCTGVSPQEQQSQPETSDSFSHALWSDSYNDFNELMENADLIITGSVISQTAQQRNDLVFTLQNIIVTSVIEGNVSAKRISVLQTGGSINSLFTPPIEEAPLLDVSSSYVLALRFVHSSVYGDYYLIMGGYQGVSKISNNSKSINHKQSLNILEKSFNESVAKRGTGDTQVFLYWGPQKTNITCYISPTISTVYGSTITNHIVNAMNSWNNICSKKYVQTTGTTFDVGVFMNNYQSTGWDGLMTPNLSGNEFIYAGVSLNNFGQASGTYFWRAVACHELGHALGLDHNTFLNVSTVMAPNTPHYYGTYGIYTPQQADKNGLVNDYGNP